MRSNGLPYDISIPEPCQADWHGMQPVSSAARHCESCARQVHDLSRLSVREIRRLVDHTGGQFCARVTHRQDGSLLLRDEPARPAVWPGAGLVLAAALASAGIATSADAQAPTRTETRQILGEAQPVGRVQPHVNSTATAPANNGSAVQVNDPASAHVALGGLIRPVQPPPALESHLQGHLFAPDNRPVHAGTVTLISTRGRQYTGDVRTDGQFNIAPPPGKYTVTANLEDSQGAHWYGTEAMVVKQGDQARDFRPSEPVQVTAGAPMVSPSQAGTTK